MSDRGRATVAVASAGYLGDVAPYVPIANELVERGHDVTFLMPRGFHALFAGERFALAEYPLDFSPDGMRDDPRHRRLMRHPLRNSVGLGRYMMAKGYSDDPDGATASLQRLLVGADVLLTHPAFATVGQPVAAANGVPVVLGHLFPMLIPTRAWAPAMPDRQRNLGPGNRAMWAMAAAIAHLAFRGKEIGRLRRELGLGPASMMRMPDEAEQTVMLLPERYYDRTAPDWPEVSWGGFSIWPGPAGQALSPELDAYIDDGEPPVLVTLGTSAALNAGEQFARIADDLDHLGVRSVILAGGSENLAPLRGRPGVVEFAPLTALLPRCRAAVVSGALGSVAATLSAGIPMVVHPQLVDQRWHGRRVEDLGVGLMARRTKHVARAVDRVLSEPDFARAAATFAAAIADHDGVVAAADVVEKVALR